jgi:hypothetical protein
MLALAPETWASIVFLIGVFISWRTGRVVFGIVYFDNLMVVVRVARFH